MDNHLMIFESADFGRVRSVLKDGAPWFVAVDVCKALGLNQVTRAMSRLDSDEGGLLEVPHPQNADKTIEINAVSEAGLYHLILCSKKPEAKAFKRWITHEVIPSIRKHGAYMTDSLLDALEAHPEAVPEYLNRLRSENARNRELTRRLRLALPKAEYYDAFVDPADCTNIRTTAKELGVPEKQFTRYLEEKKYLFRDKNRKLFPRAVKKSAGLFLVRDFYTERGKLGHYTLITQRASGIFWRERMKFCLNNAFNPLAVPSGGDEYGKTLAKADFHRGRTRPAGAGTSCPQGGQGGG